MARRAITTDPRRAIGYVRVSTADQQLGSAAQIQGLSDWSRVNGVCLVRVDEDHGVSGASELSERPGLVAALNALRDQRAGILLVAKRDRIARDVVIAATIERAVAKHGARVVSVDGAGNGEGPAEEFMRTVIDGAAQYERALIRSRTKAALATKKARGERVGTVPYGYRLAPDGVRIVPDEAEMAVIALARVLRAEGRTVRSVVEGLTERRLFSRSGKPFALARVHAMLSARS